MDQELLTYLEGFISPDRIARFEEVLALRTKFLTVAMEDVYQMHNTSAVIRSCDVFGVQEVHAVEDRFGKRLDKNIAMGAQQWVDVHTYKDTHSCIQHLKKEGYAIVATSPHYDSHLLEDFAVDRKTALFFGTEREGLSEQVLEQADGFLKIPMVGFSESLNISVSVAIVLHALSAQVRASDVAWGLTEEEQLELRLRWTKRSIKSIDGILERYYQERGIG